MNQDIAQEIIILRAKHGWTQQMLAEKLAQACGLPENYFLERAEEEPAQGQIEKIIKQIDGVLSESEQFGTEEGKRKILKRFQEVLSEFPADGQDLKK